MGFFSGMFFGILFGVGIIVAFARYEASRSKRRSDLAKTVAAFARMTVEDSRKILPPQFYPPWVVFTQRQKLDWLNTQLAKMWPFVDEAASELIRSNVEPILEQHTPAILDSLTFSKLTLGTVAPQFTGIAILEEESGPDKVTMELEMKWDGNPNIVLDINTHIGVALPVQVKDIAFTGVFRLIFSPLVDEFPAFGAVCYSLFQKKDLDFTLKVIGGDISSIPGVADAIEETIKDAIEDSITWPVRNIVPIIQGDYSHLELKPQGTLEVRLVQAKGLTNKELIGKSDPFALLFVRPLRDRTKQSKTINNDLNPVWNEHFEFIVEDPNSQSFTVRVFDDDGIQNAEFLGAAQVQIRELEPGKVKEVWLKLVKELGVQRDNKYRGEVHLELLYIPIGLENHFNNPFNPDYSLTAYEKTLKDRVDDDAVPKKNVFVRGVLSVTVISAEDLPVVDLLGKADPFVVLMLKKSDRKHKTRVVNECLNPVWNQTFDFVVEDALHDLLIIEVWDHDTFGKEKIGRVILTFTRIILKGEFQDTFALNGSPSGKITLHFRWKPQHKKRDQS
ncbi:synaptotagmin-4-like isoform X1 [Prosopis cineraria]|uniref:synaptotagmin-4-like isoform X1 n=1 Tax=Prosopis cineraria TaxID=364024 RepID=UPI00240FAE2E|nr:synaptotagmin-4-like isoform X1 [Prosopis cineraria]